MRKILLVVAGALIFGGFLCLVIGWQYTKNQGLDAKTLTHISHSKITQKSDGVFVIKSNSWNDAVEAQGFAVAGERMFQMDLMRRKADGALSELIGQAAVDFDISQRKQNWRFYASKSYLTLESEQRDACDSYAKGVNEFLNVFPNKVGIEYSILRTKPAPWSCVDSLLIALLMTDNMTQGWQKDLAGIEWKQKLPEEWLNFLFSIKHPWNTLWFDPPTIRNTTKSILQSKLPLEKISPDDFQISLNEKSRNSDGSNSWAYRGKNGAWLANDPHLGYQVPQLWVPFRLEFETEHFIVGTALPGVPGILIGMNEHLAWSITNTGEDVDDALLEDMNVKIEESSAEIKVKGKPSVQIQVRMTKNGPILDQTDNNKFITRKWLPLYPKNLSIPSERMARASNWSEFNAALDEFKFVPLSFTMLDKQSNMGLRISGCDLQPPSSDMPEEISCSTTTRRRLYYPASMATESAYISTANEQLWEDGKAHNWVDDDRANHIREVLGASSNLTLDDMRLLQLNSKSKFHQKLLMFLINYGDLGIISEQQKHDWQNWTGDPRDCGQCMTEADLAAKIFDQIIIKKVSRIFNVKFSDELNIISEMKRAKVLYAIENDSYISALGFEKLELVNGILREVSRKGKINQAVWSVKNRNIMQHPFVGRIPILGNLFQIESVPQYGSSAAIRSEKPTHGPSMRLIWNPSKPNESLWAFPIGISGHPLSTHYKDWLINWQNGGMSKINLDN